jgi:hypothetical protein
MGLTKAERAALLKAPLRIHLGRLHLTFEKAQAANDVDGKYVVPLVPLHVVPDPEGPRMSKVLGELFFALSTLPHDTSFNTRLVAEFGRVAWPEYLSVDIERAWLLTDWLVRTMAPAWLRWDGRDTLALMLETLPIVDGEPTVMERVDRALSFVQAEALATISASRLFLPASFHAMPVWNAIATVIQRPTADAAWSALIIAEQAGFRGADSRIPGFTRQPFSVKVLGELEQLARPVMEELDRSLASVIRDARALTEMKERHKRS